jgi:EAL domain-containing protein (putative c-di-GMP-specific phosphodiesterase class I)
MSFSILKIDYSFIRDLCATGGTYSIVQAIISMAHSLGHVVVAEGVETEMQLACLHQLDCDLLQGFLLAHPLRPEEIPALTNAVHPTITHLTQSRCLASHGPSEARMFST